MLKNLVARIRSLRSRRAIASEAKEELAFHVEQETRANIERGLSPSEARRIALRELGGAAQVSEAVRRVRALGIESLGRDLRMAVRSLVRSPRFALTAFLTLVVAIGGLTAVCAFVNSVLLRPLPFPDPDRLVVVEASGPRLVGVGMNLDDLAVFKRECRSLDGWALFPPGHTSTIDGTSTPVEVQDMRVTPDVFRLFGIGVVLGRPLAEADAAPGAPPVAVIGHDLWQSRFSGSPDVIGQSLSIGDEAVTIVGVAAAGADVPGNWLSKYPAVFRVSEAGKPDRMYRTVAHLRHGASLAIARTELAAAATMVARSQPEAHKDFTVKATILLDTIVRDTKQLLWIFFAAVACIVLIAVANLISLQVVRHAARERELCLRAALGAGRWDLIRPAVIESLLLSVVSGTCGIGAGWFVTRVLRLALPEGFPRGADIGLDARVALFALAVTAAIGLALGAVPAWRVARPDLASRIRPAGTGVVGHSGRSVLQRLMVAGETALACLLLVGATLLANSFARLLVEDAGVREQNLWVATALLPQPQRYSKPGEAKAFWRAALASVRQLPQVQSAAVMTNSAGPLSNGDIMNTIVAAGSPKGPGEGIDVSDGCVSGDFFETTGTRVIRGRPILASDTYGKEPVVVLNELAASLLWPGQDAIGKQVDAWTRRTVVGIVPTFKSTDLSQPPSPQMYASFLQPGCFSLGVSTLVMRVRPGARGLADAVSGVLSQMDKDVHPTVRSMAAVRWESLAVERFRTFMLVAFAATAGALALIGVSGLVSAVVIQRYREAAIRVALGATHRQVMQVVMREAAIPASVGLVAGFALARLASGAVSAFLFGVPPNDAVTFIATALALALAILLATLIPARKLLQLDPIVALRHD